MELADDNQSEIERERLVHCMPTRLDLTGSC